MFKQILLGLLVAGIGGLMVYYSQGLSDSFGRVNWFEKNFGSTKNGYVILGFLIMIIGMLILFGVIPTTSPIDSNIGGFSGQVN